MRDERPDKAKVGWIKIAVFVVVALLALLLAKGLGSIVGRSAVDRYTSGYMEGALPETLKEATKQLRSQAPIRVDEITTLRDAITAGNEIIYLMELRTSMSSAEIAVAKQFFTEENAKQVCADKKMRTVIDLGGTMTWRYTVQSGQQFSVSLSDCA